MGQQLAPKWVNSLLLHQASNHCLPPWPLCDLIVPGRSLRKKMLNLLMLPHGHFLQWKQTDKSAFLSLLFLVLFARE